MKNLIITIFILIISSLAVSSYAQSNVQTQVSFEDNENEGSSWLLNNFYSHNFENWSLNNISYFKFSETDPFYQDYYKNYIRNRLSLSRVTDSYFISVFTAGEYYTDDNNAVSMTGYPERNEKKSGFSFGSDFGYHNDKLSSVSKFKYRGRNFEAADQNGEKTDNTYDADLRVKSKLIANVSKEFKPFIEVEHYNDLNNFNRFKNTVVAVGLEQSKRINTQYNLIHSITAGFDDLETKVPFFSHYQARATAKFSQDWMFMGHLSLKSWLDEDATQLYYGNSFVDGIMQHNLSFTRDNVVNRYQLGIKHELYEDKTILKANIQYQITKVILFAEYKRYIGDYTIKNQKVYGELSTNLMSNKLRLSYGATWEKYQMDDDELTHRLAVDMNL